MPTPTDRQTTPDDRAAEEAIGWFVLLRDSDITQEDSDNFSRWLAADPENRRAWTETQQLWDRLERPNFISASGPPRTIWRMAAAIGIIAIGLGWLMTPANILADQRTSIGENRLVSLDDGSQVELGTASAFDVNFTADRREVSLLSGEVFFTVTPDPKRPFVVKAGDGRIVVRGTAFNVKMTDDITVSVTQHTVEVSTPDSPAVSVTEGHEVTIGATGISPIRDADLNVVQAWRQGQMVFVDAPLQTVVEELQRYRHGTIRLLGSDLGKVRVTAAFDIHKTDEAIETIAHHLDLQIYRASDFLIALRKKS